MFNKRLSLVLTLIAFTVASCNSTPVKTDNSIVAGSSGKPAKQSLDSNDMLSQLNSHRKALGLPALRWSNSLTEYANEWASRLASTQNCNLMHRPQSGNSKQIFGENLFYASAIRWNSGKTQAQQMTPKAVVDGWVSEKANYNYASNRCAPGKMCGHYTQVVWKNSTEVGCAKAYCSNKSQVWVCNFNPPGNYEGQRPY